MDDVGVDQMKIFGYGGRTAPRTPNVDAIARAGVRFRNVWSMPECSPSRAIFFEGRFPLRTNVKTAILSDDLANSQVSPFEATTPKLLTAHGYDNALFGKFHLAGPDNNPFGEGTSQPPLTNQPPSLTSYTPPRNTSATSALSHTLFYPNHDP